MRLLAFPTEIFFISPLPEVAHCALFSFWNEEARGKVEEENTKKLIELYGWLHFPMKAAPMYSFLMFFLHCDFKQEMGSMSFSWVWMCSLTAVTGRKLLKWYDMFSEASASKAFLWYSLPHDLNLIKVHYASFTMQHSGWNKLRGPGVEEMRQYDLA